MPAPKLSRIAVLAAKDWSLFWSDRRAAFLCFLVPVLLASAFGIIFDRPQSTGTAVKLPLLLVVESESPYVDQLAQAVVACDRVDARIVSRAEALTLVAERSPGVAVVLPKSFETLATWTPGRAGDRPRMELLHNPLCTMEAQWAEGVVTEVVLRCIAKAQLGPLVSDTDTALTLPFQSESTAIHGDTQTEFNPYSHSFCGMTLQYLLFWGMESGLLLLRERNRSLWQRMRSAPVSLTEILFAKALATATIALLLIGFTFLMGNLIFGVTVNGSVFGFVFLAMAISALAAVTGLMVAAVGGTEARARSVCILVILGVSMIGGLWLPSYLLPGWVRELSLAMPTTWAMRGLEGVAWQGRGLIASLPSLAAVAGFTACFLAVAVARLVSNESRRRRGYT